MIAKPSHHSVQNDCIEEQRDTRQNSRQVYGDKLYHTPQVRISNSSKRSIKFDENCVPTKEPSHNNPEEAADYMKAVNTLLQSFVNDIRCFNHYK